MPDVDLSRRQGVEIVKTGSWRLLSGSWSPNRKDILAAVEAAQCPAVRRPKLKLGHLDPRFNEPDDAQFDGTPSLGWFDNLRAADNGDTLLGDQVALPWLSKVQAAAYPDRSIEGTKNARCALGHVHPFVITAVSLLGETPPGIPTLKSITSLDDLPAALGVAASGDDTEGGELVEATVRAAAGTDDAEPVHTGAMVALIPTAADAQRLALDGGEPASELHVTLAYLGEAADINAAARQDIIDAVSMAANGLPQITADIFAVALFNPGDENDREPCQVYLCSGELLDGVHSYVGIPETIEAPLPTQHAPWIPHITIRYGGEPSQLADLAGGMGPVTFDTLRIAIGDQHVDIPLIGDEDGMDASDYSDDELVAASAAAVEGDDQLKIYWLGKGLKRWATDAHPWRKLYSLLLPKIKNPEKTKRIVSAWYRDHFGHMPNQKVKAGEAVLAGRHSLPEFEEAKHKRDGNGKFATKWNAGALKQGGKLDSRIKLGPDESLAGGASIPTAGIALAAIDSPNGRKLRLGLNINEEDTANWSGADKGHTAVLDQAGVEKLSAAIGRMQDGAKLGKDTLKVFDKREADLHKQEQVLLNKQYPKLTKQQGRELGQIDRELTQAREDVDIYSGRQRERIASIPDVGARKQAEGLDAEITAARNAGNTSAQGDGESRIRALLVEHGPNTDITAMMYARNAGQIADRNAEIARLQARRAELTADPVPLSASDQGDLDQLRADMVRNDDLLREFNDGSNLASGTVAAEWGDIRWEATMSSDEPTFRMAVIPKGADTSQPIEFDPIDAADLRKLGAMLAKAGDDPGVKAAAEIPEKPPTEAASSILPAAEPEPENTDPKEDLVSTDLSAFRSRLGLDDTADEQAILSALDALKTKAETPPAPTEEMVAASAAATEKANKAQAEADNAKAEKDELRKEVTVLASQVQTMSEELSTAKAEKANTVKASVFDAAIKDGKIKPADRETWEKDYDEAPAAVTRVLASIAVGTAVPVLASGSIGDPEPSGTDDEFEAMIARLDSPTGKAV